MIWRRRTSTAAIAVILQLVLAGCLAPDQPDPTGNAPFGNIDSAVASGTAIRITGWVIDPNTTAPIYVTMSHLSIGSKHLADVARPDVAKVHPKYGSRHGFDITTPSSGANAKTGEVCLWAENVGAGKDDRILGCRTVSLRSDDAAGKFESVTAVNPRLMRISGWGLDPETTSPVQIRYTVDGGAPAGVMADRPRPDINKSTGVAGNHGFSVDIPIEVGRHEVCVSVPGIGRGTGADLGCRTILTESASPVGPGADLLTARLVGPSLGHPLSETDRDAGVSAVLGDGSVLWLFGDTAGWNSDGTLSYFVNNTAAWATSADPTATSDGVASGLVPHQFAFPVEPFTEPCPPNWKSAMWPMSAVAVPIEDPDVSDPAMARNRVVAFMGNVCMGGAWEMQSRGVSVAEWEYDPAAPPDGQAVVATVTEQNLFGAGDEYATAAYFDGTYIKAYKCGRPADDGLLHFPSDPAYGPCTVARVHAASVASRDSWEFWSGGVSNPEWSDDQASAAAMDVPGDGVDRQMPVTAFSIDKDPWSGSFLMTYSPWPGITPWVYVRRADRDTGPWSPPLKYQMPGCVDSAKGEGRYCYAAIGQPFLSTETELGIGYFDQLIALNPPRGGYLAGTVARRGFPPGP